MKTLPNPTQTPPRLTLPGQRAYGSMGPALLSFYTDMSDGEAKDRICDKEQGVLHFDHFPESMARCHEGHLIMMLKGSRQWHQLHQWDIACAWIRVLLAEKAHLESMTFRQVMSGVFAQAQTLLKTIEQEHPTAKGFDELAFFAQHRPTPASTSPSPNPANTPPAAITNQGRTDPWNPLKILAAAGGGTLFGALLISGLVWSLQPQTESPPEHLLETRVASVLQPTPASPSSPIAPMDTGSGSFVTDDCLLTGRRFYGCQSGAQCRQLGAGAQREQDWSASFDHFHEGCRRNDAASCLYLGFLYDRGQPHGSKEDDKATACYQKACDGGSKKGCFNYGAMLEKDGTSTRHFSEALRLYRSSCQRGLKPACKRQKLLQKRFPTLQ